MLEDNYTKTPAMTDEESACLARNLPSLEGRGKAGVVLEFGLGGTTRFMFEQGIFGLYAVDDNQDWIEAVKSEVFFDFFIKKNRLVLHHADIGPCEAWGHPSTIPNPAWLAYHQHVWQQIPGENENKAVDFVLIDGRFRVACACQALLRCTYGVTLFIHDFWDRKPYHCLLEFTEVIDRAGSTAVLAMPSGKEENGIMWRRVALTLQKHQFDLR